MDRFEESDQYQVRSSGPDGPTSNPFKPPALAVCMHGAVGLVTGDQGPAPRVMGSEGEVWDGVQLTDKLSDPGDPWQSSHPEVVHPDPFNASVENIRRALLQEGIEKALVDQAVHTLQEIRRDREDMRNRNNSSRDLR